jgi:small conductance mechanosensitive channel
MLLILRPFRAGEYIDAGGIEGTIMDIGLFATEMKMLDGGFLLVPNSQLWNVPVTNFSRHETRRFDLELDVSYTEHIEQTEKLLMDIAEKEERVLEEPAPATFVSSLGDSAVVITLCY